MTLEVCVWIVSLSITLRPTPFKLSKQTRRGGQLAQGHRAKEWYSWYLKVGLPTLNPIISFSLSHSSRSKVADSVLLDHKTSEWHRMIHTLLLSVLGRISSFEKGAHFLLIHIAH